MNDEYAEKRDLDGLGERVNSLRLDFVSCKSGKEIEIKNMSDDTRQIKSELVRVWEKLDDLGGKVSGVTAKVSISVSLIIVAMQLLFKYILK